MTADEINRASPRTQSALLEVMSEQQVSADGVTYVLESPFIVLATENPIEYQGSYELPEAQLDRFAMQLSLGYPDNEAEIQLLKIVCMVIRQKEFRKSFRVRSWLKFRKK